MRMCSIYQHTHTHTHTHTHSEKPPFTSAHKSLMAKNLTGAQNLPKPKRKP